ncbi:type II secretion system F family protein [Ornithinimicrobium sp. W1679]|uniref:type II secretion system F family protein n=1 Tax=Ornithinimicrobium sp. W1679 TaxID=3418770 RepID=UPI003CF3C2F2
MTPTTLVVLAAVAIALAVPLAVWSFTAAPGAGRERALHNLQRDLPVAPGEERSGDGHSGILGLARRLTPAGSVHRLDGLLAQAGRPTAWPLERVLVTKLLGAVVAVALASLLLLSGPSIRMALLAIFIVAFVWFLPDLLLYNTAIKRRQAIALALPDTLDQLTIAVEAGLGFESALAHVSRNSRGPLAQEFLRTLQDIQVGLPRREAYTRLTERVDVVDLRRFVRAIIQAEQHGVSIARVLATQAREMRIKRRQRAEEKAMKIPVKVVFPLVLFILPALFIVILGPAVINTLETFSNM